MDYKKHTILSGELTENQNKIISDFDLKSGIRASKKDTYISVDVGFYKSKLFHVSFKQ